MNPVKWLLNSYIDNVCGFVERTKVLDAFTQQYNPPNEELMRRIEEECDIPEQMAWDFRRAILVQMGSMAVKGQDVHTNSLSINTTLSQAVYEYWCKTAANVIKLREFAELHPTVLSVAKRIIAEKKYEDTPILADALEEAGFGVIDALEHLRDTKRLDLHPECAIVKSIWS